MLDIASLSSFIIKIPTVEIQYFTRKKCITLLFLVMGIYKYFFIDDKKFYKSSDKLKGNPRIVRFDPLTFLMKGLKVPSPSYHSVEDLIVDDKRFKAYKKAYLSTSKLIVLDENIEFIKEMVLATDHDNQQAGRMLKHLIEGNRKKKSFTGIHHMSDPIPSYVFNFIEILPPNKQGVYKASFELELNGNTFQKQEDSTMFPSNWDNQKLYEECLFALDNQVKTEGDPLFFRSITKSGIPVEIYYGLNEKGKEFIKTLYPIWIAD